MSLRAQRTPLAVLAGLLVISGGLAGCEGDTASDTGEPQTGQTDGVALELPGPHEAREWSADDDPLVDVEGQLTFDGEPVSGARIRVGDYVLWAPTDDDGRFSYPLDATLPRRYTVSVASAGEATVDGEELAGDQLAAFEQVQGSITAAHRMDELEADPGERGIAITGRVTLGDEPVQPVALNAYELTGTVTDARGRPVEGAIVSTRTTDRDFWTFSDPSDGRGRYSSNFGASDRIGSDPVPITVHVAVGDEKFAFLPEETVEFARLKSAEMDIRLPPEGFPLAMPKSQSYPGAQYKGVAVGATADGRPVQPVHVTWPDQDGRFELVLPENLAGETVSLWAGELELFSRRPAEPGGPIDLVRWPTQLPPDVPRNLAELELPAE
ncbi:MAG: hypothetical protein GEU93_21710 [Propionibacteriales bacterium]|nr:hypothetical protein [Propionibacteriales bacterium]